MEARPKIKINLTQADKLAESLCVSLLTILWAGTILFFSKLPDIIPTHFNAAGQADDWGSKGTIFILPIIATLIYAALTFLNRYPHIYNYTATVTQANAKGLYTAATRLIRVLKLAIMLIFTGLVFFTYRASLTGAQSLPGWFLYVVVLLVLLPNILYFLKRPNVR